VFVSDQSKFLRNQNYESWGSAHPNSGPFWSELGMEISYTHNDMDDTEKQWRVSKHLIPLSIFGGLAALGGAMYTSTVLLLKYVKEDGQRLLVNTGLELVKKGAANPELIPFLSKAFADTVPMRESMAIMVAAVFGGAVTCGGK
jgi:hypothetical protein